MCSRFSVDDEIQKNLEQMFIHLDGFHLDIKAEDIHP